MKAYRSLLYFILFLLVFSSFPNVVGQDNKNDPALEVYFSANALYNRKLYSLAKEEYEAFLKKYSSHEKASRAKLGLALCHYALGKKNKAEPLLSELVEENDLENQQEIHNLWGQCLLSIEKFEEAEKAFTWSVTNGNEEKTRRKRMK